jgi:hypothetical protein
MTPAEAATAILSKTKDSCGKLAVELDHEDGDEEGNEGSSNGEDGEEMLLSQNDKTTATQKRRNPVRVGKSAQEQSQNPKTTRMKKAQRVPIKAPKIHVHQKTLQ